ncbi:MAG: hypothetical protein MRY72_05685 [Aquisalinus sp.]|nr:hypothetical protein [Aquisalinus sp.]
MIGSSLMLGPVFTNDEISLKPSRTDRLETGAACVSFLDAGVGENMAFSS